MEIKGQLIQKLPVSSGTSAKGQWQSQEIIIETLETYPKKIAIEFFGDKVSEIDKLNINDQLTVSVNIESREFNGKWYTKVKAWKVVVDKAAEPQKAPEPEYQTQFTDDPQTDDLPF